MSSLRRTPDAAVTRTAYVVDDEPEVTRALRRAMTACGYQVVGSATDPHTAIAEIPRIAPDVVILDLDLGHALSGIDVALRLRPGCDVPILFLTGASAPDLRSLTDHDGVVGYLPKPVAVEVLRTTIELLRIQHDSRTRLRDLEHRYHALFDQAAVGVIQLDARNGRMLDVNRKCAEIFDCPIDQLAGNELTEWCEPADRARLRTAIARLAGGDQREHTDELCARRRDGSSRWIRIDVSPLGPLDGGDRLVVIVQDVTDRRGVEDMLERHRELLTQSQRMASIGSYRLDFATGEINWTEEMYRVYGVSPASFVPTPASVMSCIHPDDRDAILAGMSAPPTLDETSGGLDFRVVTPDGSTRWLRGHGELVLDGAGRAIGVVGTTQDITERERALSASREAIEASRAKTDFLAHMSHELRTPLNAVLGLSEALLEQTFGPLADPQANALATIHDSGRHLLELINDVLDIARVESGKFPIEAEQVLLRGLIDESTALVYAQLTLKGQRMVIELEPALPPVDVDKRRIKQVLLNLLGNASKFSPPGTTVTLRARSLPAERLVEMAVSDGGPGIARRDQARIFEPFVTLDRSMAREHAGAGLGLTLVKHIVELHGGSIRLESEPGAGSTFTVRLPMAADYAGEAPVSHIRAPLPPRRPTAGTAQQVVLLAEDHPANVVMVRTYLESQGYVVRVVNDGLAAVDAAAASDVAVVVMDIQLPLLDGLDATRRIRGSQNSARMPIIALTAYAMPGDRERCIAAGASAYLSKPVRLRELAETIERVVAPATGEIT